MLTPDPFGYFRRAADASCRKAVAARNGVALTDCRSCGVEVIFGPLATAAEVAAGLCHVCETAKAAPQPEPRTRPLETPPQGRCESSDATPASPPRAP